VQLGVLLRAFALTTTVNNALLILVLMLAGNSIPVKIPGAGTLMLAGMLTLVGVHGPGLAGYVLVSRILSSTETPLMALIIIGWWSVLRSHQTSPFSYLRVHINRRRGNAIPVLVPVPVETVLRSRRS
jgi:hypothetical protein